MTWVKGIDVSHYQDPKATAELAVRDGIRFAWVKVSQGRKYRDTKRYDHYHALHDAGVKVGPYHYYDFGRTPTENAANMLAASAGVTWDLPHVIDCEASGYGTKRQTADAILAFLDIVERETGRVPVVYTYASWWTAAVQPDLRFRRYPLWVARYPNRYLDAQAPDDGATTNVPAPWATWTVWQFTDSRGRLDRNVCSPQAFASLTGDVKPERPAGWQAPRFTRVIRPGQVSDKVAELALMLKAAGYRGFKATGDSAKVYGVGKQQAVRRYKRRHGLRPSDAVVGPKTWDAVARSAKAKIDAGKAR